MASLEKAPHDLPPSPRDGYKPIGETMRDQYGCHSQAWRHEVTGEMTAETAFYEADTTYGPQLNFFRRYDKMNCLTIWVFGPVKNTVVKEIMGVFFLPVMVSYAGWAWMMFRWDAWRAAPRD